MSMNQAVQRMFRSLPQSAQLARPGPRVSVGTFTTVIGDVFVYDWDAERKAAVGMTVFRGQIVSLVDCSSNSCSLGMVVIRLNDGTNLTLGNNSSVSFS